jgi:hypothetical protein
MCSSPFETLQLKTADGESTFEKALKYENNVICQK